MSPLGTQAYVGVLNRFKNKKIAVIGGGPAGLSFARLLQMRGADIKIYERDESQHSRIQGSSLDMHRESGLKVIKAANLVDEFKSRTNSESEECMILDKVGNIHFHLPAIKFFSHRPEIDRAELRDLFLSSLKPDTVQWNHHFISFVQHEDRIEIKFKDGKKATADILIGADGANSKIRPFLTDIMPEYSGIAAFLGEVEDPQKTCPKITKWINWGMLFVLGDEKTIIMHRKNNGNLSFYITMKLTEDWLNTCEIDFHSDGQTRRFLKEILVGWDPVFLNLIGASSCEMTLRKLFSTNIGTRWKTNPRVTLIGDAAYLMGPFAGEGANMAMLDALELAECLHSKKYGDIHDALQHYEFSMLRRKAAAAKETKNSEAMLHSQDAIQHTLKTFLGPFVPLRNLAPSLIYALNWIAQRLGFVNKTQA